MLLWWSQSGDHPENNLSKFGYILDMKLAKKTESFDVLGYLLEFIIKLWRFGFLSSSKSGDFGVFSQEKSFVEVEIVFFSGRKFAS